MSGPEDSTTDSLGGALLTGQVDGAAALWVEVMAGGGGAPPDSLTINFPDGSSVEVPSDIDLTDEEAFLEWAAGYGAAWDQDFEDINGFVEGYDDFGYDE